MKYFRYIVVLIGVISLLSTGCSNQIENEEQHIKVQKRIDEENNYEDFKVITNSKQVQKVRQILDNIDWKKVKVDMAHPADYRFTFQFINPEIKAKEVFYELWISPNKDKVEIVLDVESKYVQLDKDSSTELFEILTGQKLTNLKSLFDLK